MRQVQALLQLSHDLRRHIIVDDHKALAEQDHIRREALEQQRKSAVSVILSIRDEASALLRELEEAHYLGSLPS